MLLAINKGAREQIQNLMDKTENRTPGDLFRKSLATYDLLTEHVTEGGKVILRFPDGRQIIFDPISFCEEREEE